MSALTMNAHLQELGRVAFERQTERNRPLILLPENQPSPDAFAFFALLLRLMTYRQPTNLQ